MERGIDENKRAEEGGAVEAPAPSACPPVMAEGGLKELPEEAIYIEDRRRVGGANQYTKEAVEELMVKRGKERRFIPITGRQKAVIEKLKTQAEEIKEGTRRGFSVSSAMRGIYSDSTAKAVKIKNSKSWNEILEAVFPDDMIAKAHLSLIKHKNWRARADGLDKYYKIKGRYAPDKVDIRGVFAEVTDEELKERIRRAKEGLGIKE